MLYQINFHIIAHTHTISNFRSSRIQKYHLVPSNFVIKKKIYIRLRISHAIVSAADSPFYSAFVPTHKSFTSLVTTRKSYARGARTSGRDLFPCNLGQREKITRLSRGHITSGTAATTLMEDKSVMRESRDCTPVWLNYTASFKDKVTVGFYLAYLSKVQAVREWPLKNAVKAIKASRVVNLF